MVCCGMKLPCIAFVAILIFQHRRLLERFLLCQLKRLLITLEARLRSSASPAASSGSVGPWSARPKGFSHPWAAESPLTVNGDALIFRPSPTDQFVLPRRRDIGIKLSRSRTLSSTLTRKCVVTGSTFARLLIGPDKGRCAM